MPVRQRPRPFRVSLTDALMAAAAPPPPRDASLQAEYTLAAARVRESLHSGIRLCVREFVATGERRYGLARLTTVIGDADLRSRATKIEPISTRSRNLLRRLIRKQIERDVHGHIWPHAKGPKDKTYRAAVPIVGAFRDAYERDDAPRASVVVQSLIAVIVTTATASRFQGLSSDLPRWWRRSLFTFQQALDLVPSLGKESVAS